MNCEKSGEVCGCPMEPPPNDSIPQAAEGSESAQKPDSPDDTGNRESVPDAWRDEVADRLNRYRARRKAPPPRYPSLKLPFEAANLSSTAFSMPSSSLPGFEPRALEIEEISQDSSPRQAEFSQDEVIPAPIPAPTAKVIEFPRFAWAPPPPPLDQLAEPVMDKPRILDVPEIEPPAPALGGITIDPVQTQEAEKVPGIDIPLQSAPLGRRLFACFVDGSIILAASALFGWIFWKIAALRPPQIQLLSLVAGIPCLFWAAYQYLLIVHSGSTPGLRAARLELARFDGTPAPRSLRRWRILASYLSAFSLGMGYAWVFLDEDALCWHDRITHTYLSPGKNP